MVDGTHQTRGLLTECTRLQSLNIKSCIHGHEGIFGQNFCWIGDHNLFMVYQLIRF